MRSNTCVHDFGHSSLRAIAGAGFRRPQKLSSMELNIFQRELNVAKRISVINFKGGVGKTTFAFQFGAGLARFHEGARVLLIDMDHQSSLSIICLTGAEWAKIVKANKTVCEIFKPFIGQSSTFPDKAIIEKEAIKQASYLPYYKKLDLVPASLQLDDIEIDLTASHHGNAIHSEWDKRTLVCRWLEENDVDDDYDYIIFDCPPRHQDCFTKCDCRELWLHHPRCA